MEDYVTWVDQWEMHTSVIGGYKTLLLPRGVQQHGWVLLSWTAWP